MNARFAAVLAVGLFAWSAAARADSGAKRYLVAFDPSASASDRAQSLARLGARAVESVDGLDAVVAEVPAARVTSLASAAGQDPWISAVEEDVYVNWLQDVTPSFYTTSLASPEQVLSGLPKLSKAAVPAWRAAALPPGVNPAEIPWGIARVDAPAAWPVTEGDGVRVAVIDTGIDANHPDLKANVAGGYNAIHPGASWFDDNDHGTHVSGTIAGVLDGRGVVGVAPKARLYAVKVLDAKGGAHLSTIIKGLIWAARHHMQVANMSLGAPIGSVFMHLAIDYAHARGVTLVAAAGNNGKFVEYPAAYSDVIAVAASDSSDHIASFSSRGSKVEFIAPGVDVFSTVPGGQYDTYSGTSMATPHMTGLAALAVAHGASSPDAVRAALHRAARSIGLAPNLQGSGLVDAALLVR